MFFGIKLNMQLQLQMNSTQKDSNTKLYSYAWNTRQSGMETDH